MMLKVTISDQIEPVNLVGMKVLSEKAVSKILNTIGGMHEQQLSCMKSFIAKDEYLLVDETNVFSNSHLITLSRRGDNSQMNFDPQFNLLYLFSSKTNMPVYYNLLPGNIREVKAFKNCLSESGIEEAVVIADKGFYSKKNIELMEQEHLWFIIPLKRDNQMIDYSLLKNSAFKEQDSYFDYDKRIIWHRWYRADNLSLFINLDEHLMVA